MFIPGDYCSDSTGAAGEGQKPSATWALIPRRRQRVRASSASELWAGRCGNEQRKTAMSYSEPNRALQRVNKKMDNISPGNSSLCCSASSHRSTLTCSILEWRQRKKAVFIIMSQTLPTQLAASSYPGMVPQLITSINTKKWNSSCSWTYSYILGYWKHSALLLFFLFHIAATTHIPAGLWLQL